MRANNEQPTAADDLRAQRPGGVQWSPARLRLSSNWVRTSPAGLPGQPAAEAAARVRYLGAQAAGRRGGLADAGGWRSR